MDGTLLDLAPSPAEVHVGATTHDLLHRLFTDTGGAVALISGRSIDDIDRLFPGVALPVAGQHGLERRDAAGARTTHGVRADALMLARTRLRAIVEQHPELVLEDKGLSLALHYRAAPRLEATTHVALRAIASELGSDYVVQPGKLVAELKPSGSDKGAAIAEFMREAPFSGRTPAFIGDDATDELGFAVVNSLGGHSVKVGDGATIARWRLPTVRAVEHWLARACAARTPAATTRSASTAL